MAATLTPRLARTFRRGSARELTAALGPRMRSLAEVIARSSTAVKLAQVGVDEIELVDGKGTVAGTAWLDAGRQLGMVVGPDGRVLCWVRGGAAVPFLGKVPPALVSAVRKAARASAPTAPKLESLKAIHVRSVTSRKEATALPALERAQLTAAARELCGKSGLPALLADCAREGQGLERVQLVGKGGPVLDGWLRASLEDGVFFDHGAKKLNGLAISQGEVHDMTGKRTELVKAVGVAWRSLRVPKARAWSE